MNKRLINKKLMNQLIRNAIAYMSAVTIIGASAINITAADVPAVNDANGTVQTTDGTLQTTDENVEGILFENSFEDAVEPVYQDIAKTATYEKDFEYSNDIVFSSVFETNTTYFFVPEYWDSEYAYAQIEMSLSRLIEQDPASMTFMVNNVPVASYKIDYKNGKKQVFTVKIPLERLRVGYNTFDITGYVRVYDERGCIDDLSGANWVCVSKDSFIRVGYEIKDEDITISEFPYPLMSTVDEIGEELTIAVSDKQEKDELASALVLRAFLGNQTTDEDRITLTTYSKAGKDSRLVLVSMYDNLPADIKAKIDKVAGNNDLDNGALIDLVDAGVDSALLVITSKNSKCLNEAVALLMDEGRVSQEKSTVAYAKLGGIAAMQEAKAYTQMEASNYTLESFLERGINIVGPFHQVADIYLPFSGGFVLADTAKVSLNFRYSENLDFDRSMITVYWGDIPVASKKLTLENAGGDTLSFMMPDDVIGTYAGKISIAFELELSDIFCTPRMDEMPWAYVAEDSEFYLPAGSNSDYRFEDRPYPFELESMFDDLTVVVPDELTTSELDTLGRVIACYGLALKPYGDFAVEKASAVTSDAQQGNMIVLGTYDDNAFVKQLNNSLSFAFENDGSGFMSNKTVILSENYRKTVGSMQLIPSPFREGKAVLVVCGPSDSEIAIIGNFLTLAENIWKLQGDSVLIDADLEIKTYDLVENLGSTEAPVLESLLETKRPAVIFTVVATAVIALMLLAVLLILIRIYRSRAKKS